MLMLLQVLPIRVWDLQILKKRRCGKQWSISPSVSSSEYASTALSMLIYWKCTRARVGLSWTNWVGLCMLMLEKSRQTLLVQISSNPVCLSWTHSAGLCTHMLERPGETVYAYVGQIPSDSICVGWINPVGLRCCTRNTRPRSWT